MKRKERNPASSSSSKGHTRKKHKSQVIGIFRERCGGGGGGGSNDNDRFEFIKCVVEKDWCPFNVPVVCVWMTWREFIGLI